MTESNAPNNDSNEVTLQDVRRLLDIGRLLASALTPDEVRSLMAENDAEIAQRKDTGTGWRDVHHSQHLPDTKLT